MSDSQQPRNEVFDYADVMKPSKERTENDLGIEIPVEAVPLPSGGKVYPQGHPLHLRETLEITAMTAKEEDILTSRALIKNGSVITQLIKSCLVDKSFNPDEMLSGDRNALMIALRITGYGAEYAININCLACDVPNKPEFNLADLEIKPLELEPVAPGENRFDFVLPMTKKTVTFKFLTGEDEREIMTTADRMKKKGFSVENNVTSRLQHCIVAINGDTDKAKINRFIRHMPARDSLALRRHMDKSEPGVDMSGYFQCHACGHGEEVGLPIGPSFFWPDTE